MSTNSPLPASDVPKIRIRSCNSVGLNADGRFVLYWMTAFRRANWNFALDRAVDWAKHLQKPLVVVESLGCGSRWASARHHRFAMQGMAENARQFAQGPVYYHPYLETIAGEARDFFAALAHSACLVVTDDYPLPSDLDPEPWAADLPIQLEKVDGNGILPMNAAEKAFETAYAFRRFLQSHLREHLLDFPKANPFSRLKIPLLKRLPTEIASRWKPAKIAALVEKKCTLGYLPIDRSVESVELHGGIKAASAALTRFLRHRLPIYREKRGDAAKDASSGLSPYLHFGHISSHEIFRALARREAWTPDRLAEKASGRREGWWGMSQPSEAFLDELITWRELGYNFCRHRYDYASFDSLPDWAIKTLKKHAKDMRKYVYSFDGFESAATHDPLWNAAQRQLTRAGTIHNYLRMLWGKKILEWTAGPREAAEIMIELNNKYALDGGDPNSYSGIFWVLGRYDRPWGPERPIFGTVRYMSSTNAARKMRVAEYIESYS
ncbi:MAG: deoxyribodipyrimidine photolyase [Pirellulales bacterium]|nr:deoxyribodipyrimidine photolyase [Pirellulales bacterium]